MDAHDAFGRMIMLTRNAIRSGAYVESFRHVPDGIRWSTVQIEQSLKTMLQMRPGTGDVWVFGYGSLMWNPALDFEESQWATLPDWHRSFCMEMTAGRGSAELPGRMLALEPGGATRGTAFRLNNSNLDEELRLVWIREMIFGAYRPIWADVVLDNGQAVTAIVFVADPAHRFYAPDSRVHVVAPLIAAAQGPNGSNADYLYSLADTLEASGEDDPYVDLLAAAVRRSVG
jgi:cation transport protein ChaC